MSATKFWSDYSVKYGAGPSYLNGIQSLSFNASLATAAGIGDGNVFATFLALMKGAPAARFSTLHVADALAAFGVTSYALANALVCYFRKISQGGTRDAANAGTHISLSFSGGMVCPRRVSARHGSNAVWDGEVYGTSADGTNPVTPSTTANLPASLPGVATAFGLGPIKLNGTVLDGLESAEYDFGVTPMIEGRDGDIYPTHAGVKSQQPTVKVRGAHVDVLSALTLDGGYYTASQVVGYLRKRSAGGTYVADATAQHVKFTLGLCRVEAQSVDGDPKTVDLLLTPAQDTGGPTNPIAVNTASAIA